MSNELQSTQNSPTPFTKKSWNAPEIQVLNLRQAQVKAKTGIADRFGFKSH